MRNPETVVVGGEKRNNYLIKVEIILNEISAFGTAEVYTELSRSTKAYTKRIPAMRFPPLWKYKE